MSLSKRRMTKNKPLRNVLTDIAFIVAVSLVAGYANARGYFWSDWLVFYLFVGYAAYCAWNFTRCREVHCAITAPGFWIAAALVLPRLIKLAHYPMTLPWAVFVGSACLGYCIQSLYKNRTGSFYFNR